MVLYLYCEIGNRVSRLQLIEFLNIVQKRSFYSQKMTTFDRVVLYNKDKHAQHMLA